MIGLAFVAGPVRRKTLYLGTGILPVFLKEGMHPTYRVSGGLPRDSRVVHVFMSQDDVRIGLIIESDEFPEISGACLPPEIEPTIHRVVPV